MKKSLKGLLLTLAVLVFATCSVAFTALAVNESSLPENGFVVTNGAEIRDDSAGIRFSTTLQKSYYDAVKQDDKEFSVYTVINKVGAAESQARTYNYNITDDSFSDGKVTLYASIIYDNLTTEQLAKASATELVANSYIKVGDITYTAVASDTTRSMRAVAAEAIRNNSSLNLSNYVGTKGDDVNLTTFDNYAFAIDSTLDIGCEGDVYLAARKIGETTDNKIDLTSYKDLLTNGENTLTVFDKATDGTYTNNYKFVKFNYTPITIETYSEKIDFSAADGDLPAAVISQLGESASIVAAYQDATKLTVEANKVKGVVPNIIGDQTNSNVNPESVTIGDTEIVVFTENKGLKIPATAYTKLIYTADDLCVFNLATDNEFINSENKIYGYFALGGNIEYDESWGPNTHQSENSWSNRLLSVVTNGFYGVFDGRGYSMDVNMSGDGLFGRLGRSCIKNLSVTFREQQTKAGNCGFAFVIAGAWSRRVVFENLNITVKNFGSPSDSGKYSAILSRTVENNVKVNNTIINIEFAQDTQNENGKTTGLLFTEASSGYSAITFSNVYVITDKTSIPLISSNKDNVFISNGWAENDSETEKVCAGVKRYASIDDFNTATGNDYTSFKSSGYWTVTETSAPVWKTKASSSEGVDVVE